jgi:acyl-ACP thioesterase
MVEYHPRPQVGRHYSATSVVRLSDASPGGDLRLDAVARFLQDVATDDWNDSGIVTDAVWVARRSAIRFVGSSWPQYLDELVLTTWCAGTGAAWAERRTDVQLRGQVVFEATSLWVPVDATGHPVRVMRQFEDVYGEAMGGRKVSGRVPSYPLHEAAATRPWAVRHADLDVVGHVNNAAVWQALSEVVATPVADAVVIHHGALEEGDDVVLRHDDAHVWLVVGDDVRVSARFGRHVGDRR